MVRISYSEGSEVGLLISSVWLTDKDREAEPQPTFIRLCNVYTAEQTTKPIIAGLTTSKLFVANLDNAIRTLPRRRLLESECFQGHRAEPAGLPRVLQYSTTFDAIIIGTAIWEHKPTALQTALPSHAGKRVLRPGLCIAPARQPEPEEHSGDSTYVEPIPVFHLPPRQRILSMTRWFCKHEHIIVGTAVYRKDRPLGGQLFFFRLSARGGDMGMELVKESKMCPGPIRALASFEHALSIGSPSQYAPKLVVCCDKTLQVFAYEMIR